MLKNFFILCYNEYNIRGDGMREYGPKLGIIILCIVSFIIFPIYWVSKGTKYDYTIQK